MASKEQDKQISRKYFLKGMGVSLAGVAMMGSVGGLLTACKGQETASLNVSSEMEKPKWPFKYVKLDPDKAAQRAYESYKTGAG